MHSCGQASLAAAMVVVRCCGVGIGWFAAKKVYFVRLDWKVCRFLSRMVEERAVVAEQSYNIGRPFLWVCR